MRYDIQVFDGVYLWEDLKLVLGNDRYTRLREWAERQSAGWTADGLTPTLLERYEREVRM